MHVRRRVVAGDEAWHRKRLLRAEPLKKNGNGSDKNGKAGSQIPERSLVKLLTVICQHDLRLGWL